MSILIKNIKTLFGIEEQSKISVSGSEMGELLSVDNAFILIEKNKIVNFGEMKNCPDRAEKEVDATGKMVLPAWCDSHTHIVFAKSREEEFVMRIKGKSYEEIAENGGGILNSARKLQAMSEDALYDSALERLKEVVGFGTGAIEIKSGYGLTHESELKMLRVIRRLKENNDIPIKATFLGAHAIPMEYKNNRNKYIDIIINKMLPEVAGEGLADYCDVFCDKGFFTVEETDRILEAGWKYGLKPKIHANELAISGGVQIGVKQKALSVDHLECMSAAEIEALKGTETMPTLLPSTAFFLNLTYAPARQMIDAGLPVALASDYNPGSTPSGRMPFVLSLACTQMKMTPEEAVNAATINGAYAMELSDQVGSICKGKLANLILTKKIPSLAFIPYAFGSDLIERVWISGKEW